MRPPAGGHNAEKAVVIVLIVTAFEVLSEK